MSISTTEQSSERLYRHAAIRALFRREIQAIAPIVSGIYGNCGLYVRAHRSAPAELPANLLGMTVALARGRSGSTHGDVECAVCALPFANDSFNLLVAQHAYENVAELDMCVQEIARVLVPEGIALIIGFNPIGTWRPWLAWQSRRTAETLRLRSAQDWRRHLARERIDTLQVRFPGTLVPRSSGDDSAASGTRGSRNPLAWLGSSWLLLARKRRNTLTPLRLRKRGRDFGLKPGLIPGTQRTGA